MSYAIKPHRNESDPVGLLFAVAVFALTVLGSALVYGSEPAARVAVLDAQLEARAASRPDLPDDFQPGGREEPTDRGSAPPRIEAGESLLTTLAEILGPSGSLIVKPDAPVTIRRPEATLTIRPGTEIRYKLSGATGSLVFGQPTPQVEAKVLGMRLKPDLTSLDLFADNSGVARTASNGIPLPPRRFKLGWEPTPAVQATSQPITFYTSQGCGPCVTDKTAIANSPLRDLIRIVEIDNVPHRHEADNGKTYTIYGTPTYIWTGTDGIDHNVFRFADLQKYWGTR